MATDETPLEVSVLEGTAPEQAERTTRDARRIEGWSIFWMLLALLIWGCFIFLMVADYGPEISSYKGTRAVCQGPLGDPSPQDRVCRSDQWRQWPALVGILALASLATVTAAATMVYAKVLSRLGHSDGSGVRPQD
ncbi:hypothetical protein [Streptomyces avidinii]|uniref:Transmembrane protein n=1 Tax=Streptomyces avidinii TaxID=1895 RepID=A0ABS4KXC8_STRAV|nr:hypothetical protein [Streptomyces avidinii]MBP2034687.1 hypothetical protein [Streptomyces avidinii]GGY88074.1 hypothetical protein GCM10010343_11520 [Streptomyces avidinii]